MGSRGFEDYLERSRFARDELSKTADAFYQAIVKGSASSPSIPTQGHSPFAVKIDEADERELEAKERHRSQRRRTGLNVVVEGPKFIKQKVQVFPRSSTWRLRELPKGFKCTELSIGPLARDILRSSNSKATLLEKSNLVFRRKSKLSPVGQCNLTAKLDSDRFSSIYRRKNVHLKPLNRLQGEATLKCK